MRGRHQPRVLRHRNKAEKMRRKAAQFFRRGLLSTGLSYFLMAESYERRAQFWMYRR